MLPENQDALVDFDLKQTPIPTSAPALPDFVLDEPTDFSLFVVDHVLIGIRRYVRDDPKNERGGVLLGEYSRVGERDIVIVREFMPLASNHAGPGSFCFDDDALFALHGRPRGGLPVVGWFHSHPGMGAPFMSTWDVTLHEQHFPQPWFVSCVVSVGQWALPLEFFRMDGSRLVRVAEYQVRMTNAQLPGQQSERFLAACDDQNQPVAELLSAFQCVLPDLGVRQDAAIASVLTKAAEAEVAGRQHWSANRPLRVLIDLAFGLAAEGPLVAETRALRERLQSTRFLETGLFPVFTSDDLGTHAVVGKDSCFSLTPDESRLYQCDLVTNVIWPITLEPAFNLADLAGSADGSIWMLAPPDRLLYMEATRLGSPSPDRVPQVTPLHIIGMHISDPGITEYVLCDDCIWIRSASDAYRLKLVPRKPGERGLPLALDARLPIRDAVLLRNPPDESQPLLEFTRGKLSRLDATGAPVAEADMPDYWRHWRLAQACHTPCGIYVLFDDGAHGQMASVECDTLRLRAHYVQGVPPEKRAKLHSLSTDSMQRLFLRMGSTLSLVEDTGQPSPDWFQSRPYDSTVQRASRRDASSSANECQ